MTHKYKQVFEKINLSRKERGLRALSWGEFLTMKEPKEVTTQKYKMLEQEQQPEQKTFQRPPAVYDNKSVYDKYGI